MSSRHESMPDSLVSPTPCSDRLARLTDGEYTVHLLRGWQNLRGNLRRCSTKSCIKCLDLIHRTVASLCDMSIRINDWSLMAILYELMSSYPGHEN